VGDGASVSSSDLLDEVLVNGTRLRDLQAAVVKAEDRFYARYNELNKNDDFDIECRVEAPLGSKIPRRLCLTKVQLQAKTAYGREFLQSLQDMTRVPGGSGGVGKPPDTNPAAIWGARYEEYRANMLSLLNNYPELRRLAGEGEAARKRFDDEYKRRLKGRLVLME
jgi:hypothetical protein